MSATIAWTEVDTRSLAESLNLQRDANRLTNGDLILTTPGLVNDSTISNLASTDGGLTWNIRSSISAPNTVIACRALHIPPNTLVIAYTYSASGGTQFARSTDAGGTWSNTQFITDPGTGITAAASPQAFAGYSHGEAIATGNFMGVSTNQNAQVIKSTGQGSSWGSGAVIANRPNAIGGRGIINTSGGIWFAGVAGADRLFAPPVNLPLIYKSTDAGASWSPVGATVPLQLANILNLQPSIEIFMAFTDQILIGAGGRQNVITGDGVFLYRSTNGGSSWTHMSPSDVSGLSGSNPQVVFLQGRRITASWAIIGFGGSTAQTQPPWRHTSDAGLTWNNTGESGIPSYPNTAQIKARFLITDGPAIIAFVKNTTGSPSTLRIARGIITC